MGRKKKKKPIKLKLKPETVHSVGAVFLFLLGLLVMVSFTGQGQVLAAVNDFLQREIGLAMLFLPFVFFSSGLILLRAKWSWSKPNVLLGALIMLLAVLLGGRTGDVGRQTFLNLSKLIGPIGTYITAASLAVVGLLISMQASLNELIEALMKLGETIKEKRTNRKVNRLKKKQLKEHKKKGFSIDKLKFGKEKDQDKSFKVKN